MMRRLFIVGLVSIFMSAAQPSSAATKPSRYEGWELIQRHKLFGRIQLKLCPAGVVFKTPLLGGYVTVEGKKIYCTLINDENKTYRRTGLEQFKKNMQNLKNPAMSATLGEWQNLWQGEHPDKPIFGFKTIRQDYELRLKRPPYVVFPDRMWVTTEIATPDGVLKFLETLSEHQMPKTLGVPLRVIMTTHLGPVKTELTHDTLKATRKTFSKEDFTFPSNYRQAETDSEMFDFGMDFGAK